VARVSGTLAQLGYTGWTICIRVWDVGFSFSLPGKTSILGTYREGYPNIRTVDYWLGGDKSERYPQSRSVSIFISVGDTDDGTLCRVNNSHNKADGFERRLEVHLPLLYMPTIISFFTPFQLYLVENFKHSFEMERYESDDRLGHIFV